MNFKAIILISLLIMSGISSVNSKHGPNYVSGFVGEDHIYAGPIMNKWSEWVFTQYDSNGKILRKPHWMEKHEEVEVKNVPGNVIKYKYREMAVAVIFPTYYTIIKIDFYNYHGGELKIVPDKEAKLFSIYYQNNFVSTLEEDEGESVHKLGLP
ncbi:MAG: hypothetical protein CfClM3_0398 [Methanobrevibacter sp. CfCl-M3]